MTGTYVLAVELESDATIEVGALGEIAFEAGAYAYVGSAFGPGGFARVDRHRELAAGKRDARHWHVDYLLGHAAAALRAVATFPGADRECDLATALPGGRVPDFGASDCECDGHLLAASSLEAIVESTRAEGGRTRRFG